MNTPKWLDDLDARANAMPFGELEVHILRHRSKTGRVSYAKSSTLSPKSNEMAFSDLEKFINSLVLATFSGKVDFALDFEKGTIKLITIKNKEVKTYGDQTR